jgi:Super-infection exclusion protein B
MDLTKVLDWLKSSPKYLFPIALVTGLGLFSPSSVLDIFGLTSFVSQYRQYIGIVFLISMALILTEAILFAHRALSGWRQRSEVTKHRQELLQNLTLQEKSVLRNYITRKTKTAYFDLEDGVVGGLEAQGVIYRASNIGQLDRWAYNIQPWAWDYLTKNPHLLTSESVNSPEKS